jgi:hypothetical protein
VLYLCCRCDSADRYTELTDKAATFVNGTEKRKTNMVVLRAASPVSQSHNGAAAGSVRTSVNLSSISHYCREGPLFESGGLQVVA